MPEPLLANTQAEEGGAEVMMDQAWRQAIGQRIADARKARGWTYRDLHARCGVAASHLHKIEHAQVDPSIATGYAICDALGLTMDELTGRAPSDRNIQNMQAKMEDYRARIQKARYILSYTTKAVALAWNEGDERGVVAVEAAL